MGYENRLTSLLWDGVESGVFPGAVLLVSLKDDIIYYGSAGYSSILPERRILRKDTIFDLASLTKPLATTLCLMRIVDDGLIDLDMSLSELPINEVTTDKGCITIRMLLNHCAGLKDWEPFYIKLMSKPLNVRKNEIRKLIMLTELKYRPSEMCLYSDLGFILLEWVIESVSGKSMKAFIEDGFYAPMGLKTVFLYDGNLPDSININRIAPTEHCKWRKRIIHGEVHDENAYALGGYSGHAGLFGDAMGVHRICKMLLDHYTGKRNDLLNPDTVKEFFRRQNLVPGSTWALGWDKPSPEGSSSGRHFSKSSVGHLGFTGVSIWMDLERELISILLANRIHPERENDKIRAFRPLIHDTIHNISTFLL